MQYMLMYFEPDNEFASRTDPENAPAYWAAWTAYMGEMRSAGIIVNGDALEAPHTATTVSLRDGKRVVQDGPFADSKEQLGGYVIIEVADLDEALGWAAKSPAATCARVEVRPVMAMTSNEAK